jgi:hypothetical protein
MEEIFLLKTKEGLLIATLYLYSVDQPLFLCKAEFTQDFQHYKPFFDQDLEALNSTNSDSMLEQSEKIHSLELRLVNEKTREELIDFLLHIDANRSEAWFRY